tara:strand:+ start:103 stop:1098 length:996 start_codon:yes stop_codon:yes gene_type:complete
MEKILVTGGTSYIGKHCIAQLLEKGYDVRTTVRDIKKADVIKSDIKKYLNKEFEFEVFEADLIKDEGWNEAIKGCDAIFHIAGPFPFEVTVSEAEQIAPHVDGALRIFNIAKETNVNRVVMMSSVAAAYMGKPGETNIDETKWTNENTKDIDSYTKSIVLKEKAAWEFLEQNDVIKLTVINPSVVIGPGIGEPTQAGSLVFFQKLITKEMPVAPPFKLGLVDVRDVAKMFIGALEKDDSIGKRILLAENTYWIKEYCQMLINIGHKAPTFTPPEFLVKFLSNFDKALKSIVPLLGVDMKINTELAKSLLDFEPIPIQKTIKDTSNYINNYN